MLDKTMTEDQLEEQGQLYAGHVFRTSRQTPIRIINAMPLRNALQGLQAAKDAKDAARSAESSATGQEAYDAARAEYHDASEAYDDARAQAMAAMYRNTGFWPYQFYDLGLR